MAMHLSLIRLTLRNFKGIKNFTLEPNGKSVNIFGENETGKTTLPDAWNWLFFDKNAAGQKDFDVKTLDKDGNPIHHLEHEVEGVLSANDIEITLRKVLTEKWTKKRGSVNKDLTGHETSYYVDGVPVKKKEYMDVVNSIADEEKFKLMTNLTYFCEQMHWEKRRGVVIDICGDVSDEDVVASDSKLAKLPGILNGRSMDKHKAVITARQKEINKELDSIPNRIDENDRMLPDITGLDEDKLREEIETLQAVKKEKESALMQAESGGEIAEKRVQLNNLKADIAEITAEYRNKNSDVFREKTDKVEELESQIRAYKREGSELTAEFKQRKELAVKLETRTDELRAEWARVDKERFEYEAGATVCPTCGQDIPQEQLEEARARAEADFNEKKAERLDGINADGKATVEQVEALKEKQDAVAKRIRELVSLIEKTAGECAIHRGEIESLRTDEIPLKDIPGYAEKLQELNELEEAIASLGETSQEAIGQIKEQIAGIEGQINGLKDSLKAIEDYEKGQVRIKELRAQERQLSAEYEKLEGEAYLTELFTKAKVKMLEAKISQKFKFAQFKMFNPLVNGGIEECCETMHRGVPYKTNLNNGARINAGLDIINVLSEHYGFRGPVFVDNRESITKMIGTDAQVISLIVSEKDKSLRVEVLD